MSSEILEALKVIQKHRDTFINEHKVRRTGVGFKISDGKFTDTVGITIFVRHKPSIEDLKQQNILPVPSKIDGIPTDVVCIPYGFMPRISRLFETTVLPDDARYRPFAGGEAIINATGEPATGTLGIVIKRSNNGGSSEEDSTKLYGLTNNHVGANEDVEGQPPTARKGDPWTQPGVMGVALFLEIQ